MDSTLHKTIRIPADGRFLTGDLQVPGHARTLVMFSHGSGSSRLSPRNIFVAEQLHKKNIGTLLFDLLSEEEDSTYATRFDIDLLTRRLIQATRFITSEEGLKGFALGYFGASTGAASALKAAAVLPEWIKAIVSRGGRPDLAIPDIADVKAPTLLIVGAEDHDVIEMNKRAYNLMHCTRKLEIIPGATHLFEEPGTLQKAAELAADWFDSYLKTPKTEDETHP